MCISIGGVDMRNFWQWFAGPILAILMGFFLVWLAGFARGNVTIDIAGFCFLLGFSLALAGGLWLAIGLSIADRN